MMRFALAAAFCVLPLAGLAQPAAPEPVPAPPAPAAATAPPGAPAMARVRVLDAYLDMRTGPGRGYPIFHVAERDEWVTIELRHTDWFKVRSTRLGQAGWVSREQMNRTVTEDGTPFALADPTLADYLGRRFEFGGGYGASRTTSVSRAWAGWRFSDTLSLDVGVTDVQHTTSTTGIWTAGLLVEPWSDRRLSPFMGVAVGRFHYKPNQSLVNAETIDGNLNLFTLGVRYHLASRMALRVEYLRYAVHVSELESRNYQAGTVGLSIHY